MDEKLDLLKRAFNDWKKVALYVLPVAVLAGLLVAKLGMKKGQTEGDYVSAAVAFNKWEKVLDQNGDTFAKLENLVQKHPELRAEYDASIGQKLLVAIASEEATPFIERTLLRTKQNYYSDYARTSLKISKKQYQEALDEALSLKETMSLDRSYWEKSTGSSALFAFNLMRIAVLSQELNHPETELEAWREVKLYMDPEKTSHPVEFIGNKGFNELLTHFSVQETTLLDYIKAREEALSGS